MEVLPKSNSGIVSTNLSIELTGGNMDTGVSSLKDGVAKGQAIFLYLAFLFIAVGILGNFLALIKLARKKTYSDGIYTLLLRCLITNDLIALSGIAVMTVLKRCFSEQLGPEYAHWFCAFYVVFRFFGISSGCIAVIMSIDRVITLYKPLFYQKHFTRNFNRNAIIGLSLVAAVITFLPIFGFGTYFNEENKKCSRYRDAETLRDKAYAVLFLIFGTLICLVIVTCNAFVIRLIVCKSRRRNSLCSSSSSETNLTAESSVDIKFSKLMTLLSLLFVICWMPQMISIIFALKSNPLPQKHWFYNLADVLTALHFTLDPYVYVLSGKKLAFFVNLIKCWGCRLRRTPINQNSFGINNNIKDCNL